MLWAWVSGTGQKPPELRLIPKAAMKRRKKKGRRKE
jgi:hypothetical protein